MMKRIIALVTALIMVVIFADPASAAVAQPKDIGGTSAKISACETWAHDCYKFTEDQRRLLEPQELDMETYLESAMELQERYEALVAEYEDLADKYGEDASGFFSDYSLKEYKEDYLWQPLYIYKGTEDAKTPAITVSHNMAVLEPYGDIHESTVDEIRELDMFVKTASGYVLVKEGSVYEQSYSRERVEVYLEALQPGVYLLWGKCEPHLLVVE